ncbi:YigZ family protein [Roseisolibacter sp. H3M3-2]|uniref:YigZ family protein n=1 Tax=Roseisolibacter sp. H3M3-2 TaxID=3031323 RepID=UPI0023DBC5AD|nr:YigZ family protein [Roseisolibacter sp. H3M3-2]MDF1503830.1 YigZ family protein [Roseisolibacter sp. H3M3-2]
MADRYPVPADEHRTREEISRSRFVTTLAPADTTDAAHAFVARMRAEFPDATHNCWAFVVGPPGSTGRVGMSDDGEPHGTAGRPMLTALLHSGVGDVAAVVTRYYGGTKLGTGGLVRAYGGCVQRALETLPRGERVAWVACAVTIGYADVTVVQQLVAAHEGRVLGETYAADVTYALELPDSRRAPFVAAVLDATRGAALVE